MFVSLVAEVDVDRTMPLPLSHGEAMHAELLQRVASLDPSVATALHGDADGSPRPFTVSAIRVDRPAVRDGRLYLERGDRAWFRLTAIGPLAGQALIALAERTSIWFLKAFNMELRITRWCLTSGEHPWSGVIELDALFESAWRAMEADPDRVWLQFHSPTLFELAEKRWGNWMHLPIPRLVFRSLRMRARELTPIPDPQEAEQAIDNHVALGQFRNLSSHIASFQKHGFYRAGFTGECEFLFDRDLPEHLRVWLHLLANLAFYIGVGKETTRGLGQARREPSDRFDYCGTPR